MNAALFYSKVKRVEGDGCWLWQGTIRGKRGSGYGSFGGQYAHRIAWCLERGVIPYDKQVLHHCDTPACVRVAHLYLGTPADNHADKARKGRAARNTKVGRRLTDEEVAKMRRLHADGVSQSYLAKMFKVAQSTANQICTRRHRAVVPQPELIG